jgi:hypothetical protein
MEYYVADVAFLNFDEMRIVVAPVAFFLVVDVSVARIFFLFDRMRDLLFVRMKKLVKEIYLNAAKQVYTKHEDCYEAVPGIHNALSLSMSLEVHGSSAARGNVIG